MRESGGFKLGVLHAPTLRPTGCGLLLYNSYSVSRAALLDGLAPSDDATIGPMSWDIDTPERKALPRREVLPDRFYYLNNFQTVLASLELRYGELLSSEEHQFIDHFRELPEASRALLVRLVMRQSAFIRASRLKYPEIGETSAAAGPLVDRGWLDERPDLQLDELQRLLTKAELRDHFALSRGYCKFRKAELATILRAQHPESRPFHAWCRGSLDRVYHLIVRSLCERFRLMFFGNFHQDWTDFVLTDLGLFAYEKVPASLQSPAFRTRAEINAFQQLHLCRQSLAADLPLDQVTAAIPAPITDSEWLEDHRQKLLSQIARAYERQGNRAAAVAIYTACTHRGARLRRIRLRERACEWQAAHDLCLTAQQVPENEAERQQLRRLVPRLNRKLGLPKTETPAAPEVRPSTWCSRCHRMTTRWNTTCGIVSPNRRRGTRPFTTWRTDSSIRCSVSYVGRRFLPRLPVRSFTIFSMDRPIWRVISLWNGGAVNLPSASRNCSPINTKTPFESISLRSRAFNALLSHGDF